MAKDMINLRCTCTALWWWRSAYPDCQWWIQMHGCLCNCRQRWPCCTIEHLNQHWRGCAYWFPCPKKQTCELDEVASGSVTRSMVYQASFVRMLHKHCFLSCLDNNGSTVSWSYHLTVGALASTCTPRILMMRYFLHDPLIVALGLTHFHITLRIRGSIEIGSFGVW